MITPHPLFGDKPDSIPVLPWDTRTELLQTPLLSSRMWSVEDMVDLEADLARNRMEEWPKIMPVEQLAGSMAMLCGALADNLIHGDDRTRKTFIDVFSQALRLTTLLESYQLMGNLTNIARDDATVEAAAPREKTSFDVVLTNYGDYKVATVKACREITGLSLKDSKDLVESAPATVAQNVSRGEAERIKLTFERAGASAQIR